MLGWCIGVYRQADGGSSPARADSEKSTRVAVWQANAWGLRWLDELLESGQAIDLGGDGYPSRFTAQAKQLIPRIVDGPPEANAVWVCDPDDILTSTWVGKTLIDRTAADDCGPDEWLLVIAWDES